MLAQALKTIHCTVHCAYRKLPSQLPQSLYGQAADHEDHSSRTTPDHIPSQLQNQPTMIFTQTSPGLHSAPLYSTLLHSCHAIPVHSNPLGSTPLHYIPRHAFRARPRHASPLQLHATPLHEITPRARQDHSNTARGDGSACRDLELRTRTTAATSPRKTHEIRKTSMQLWRKHDFGPIEAPRNWGALEAGRGFTCNVRSPWCSRSVWGISAIP